MRIRVPVCTVVCSGTHRGPGVPGVGIGVAGDDLHEIVVGVGGQGVAPAVQPEGGAAGQPQVKHQVRGLLYNKKLNRNRML